MDDFERVLDLLNKLQTETPSLTIRIRPHPSYKYRNQIEELAVKQNYYFSSPTQENIYGFLKNTDCLIAGDSSVHLDATYLNIPSIFYSMGAHAFDYYEYAKNKLVFKASNSTEVVRYLNEFLNCLPNVREKAKYYLASIGENYDGEVADYQAELLQQILSQN